MASISTESIKSPSLPNKERELKNNGRTVITKTSVYDFHEEQLLSGDNNNHNTMKLVNILGGIDKILSHYLSETNNLTLANRELEQIYQTITTPGKYQQTTKHEPLTILNHTNNRDISMEGNDNKQNKHFYYSFNKFNTYLVSIFGMEKATKISNMLYSTPTIVILICSLIMYYITQILWWKIYLIFRLFVVFTWIPIVIVVILEINREIFKVIIYSFELWFKLCYAFLYVLFRSINGWDTMDFKFDITLHILILALIFVTCLFDALNIRRSAKILLSSIAAIVFSFFSILYQFSYGYQDYIIHITSDYSISTLSIMASTTRVLAIFLCRQAMLTIRRKDRFILIRYSPYIKWDVSHDKVDIYIETNNVIVNNNDHETILKQTTIDMNETDLRELRQLVRVNKKPSMSLSYDVNSGIEPKNKERYQPDLNQLGETKCIDNDCEFQDDHTISTNQLDASLLTSTHRQHIEQCHRKLYQRLQILQDDGTIQLEVKGNNQLDSSHN